MVTEFDLATGKRIRSASLPLEPGVTMKRLDNDLVVLGRSAGSASHDGVFVLLSTSMKVVQKSPIKWMGEHVQAIASDNKMNNWLAWDVVAE